MGLIFRWKNIDGFKVLVHAINWILIKASKFASLIVRLVS